MYRLLRSRLSGCSFAGRSASDRSRPSTIADCSGTVAAQLLRTRGTPTGHRSFETDPFCPFCGRALGTVPPLVGTINTFCSEAVRNRHVTGDAASSPLRTIYPLPDRVKVLARSPRNGAAIATDQRERTVNRGRKSSGCRRTGP